MPKIEEIKKQIQTAIDAVKDFDEPYRSKAFEVILSKSIERIAIEKDVKAKEKGKPSTLEGKIEKFAESSNLSVGQLENVFEFSENNLKFITPLSGSIAERQVSFTQCVLIALEKVFGKKSINALDLAKKLDDYGLSGHHLARNLQRHPNIFRKIGKKRGTKYKLTDVGKSSALELVRALATSRTQS